MPRRPYPLSMQRSLGGVRGHEVLRARHGALHQAMAGALGALRS
jgi:hypothetical protein